MSLHDIVWRAGAPARATLIGAIHLYRTMLSGWLGGQCRFYPTCSHYAEGAIREHGAVRGVALATWRVARCNPYSRGGIDPVPHTRHRRPRYSARYDEVIYTHEEARA